MLHPRHKRVRCVETTPTRVPRMILVCLGWSASPPTEVIRQPSHERARQHASVLLKSTTTTTMTITMALEDPALEGTAPPALVAGDRVSTTAKPKVATTRRVWMLVSAQKLVVCRCTFQISCLWMNVVWKNISTDSHG